MSIEKVVYRAHATATGGRDGRATSSDGVLDVKLGGRQHLFGVRHAAHQLHHRLRVDDIRIVGVFAALIDGRMRLGSVAARAFYKRVRHFLSLRASSA